MSRKIVFLLSLFLLVFLVVSCGPESEGKKNVQEDGAASSVAAVAPSSPEFGGIYVTGTIGEPSNLVPALASDSSSQDIAGLLYVPLLKYDKNLVLIPWGAEKFEILDEGRLLRFSLRPGIRWTDGEEMTAEDVRFTYELMINPKTPTAYAESYRLVKEFRVTGRYTFEVAYDEPYARALSSWSLSPMPRHLFKDENLLETKYSRHPVSNGPYIIKEWKAGSHLVRPIRIISRGVRISTK